MDLDFFPAKKALELFGYSFKTQEEILHFCQKMNLPPLEKKKKGVAHLFGWPLSLLPELGKKISFIKRPRSSRCLCVFTTKGGVLKSTLSFNIARMSAISGLKTCVVGLDIQGDISQALGSCNDVEADEELSILLKKIDQTKGLNDMFSGNFSLEELILPTDIPNLSFIPETPELASLNDSLNNILRREYWLKEKVVLKLKEKFDLIVLDCSPNWNKLTTNALVACDLLVSPLECKINNFRNFKVFRHFLKQFKDDLLISFDTIFIPTKYSKNKKLSKDILQWYVSNLSNCHPIGIKECLKVEESMALKISLLEYSPKSLIAKDFRSILAVIFDALAKEEGQNNHPKLMMNHVPLQECSLAL